MNPPKEASPKKVSLTYSLADQSFARTKSIGILNVSLDFLRVLAQRPECDHLTVLANPTLSDAILPTSGMTIQLHDRAAGGGLSRIWWDQFGAYTAARRAGHEWLFLPKGFASFARRCPVRLATLIHDLMQDHYDRHYPDFVSGWEAAYFRAALRASMRQSDIIFTPTESVRREIEHVIREKGWPLPRLVCCGEGFTRPAALQTAERRDLMVLAGRFPHKLTRRAVEFLSRWRSQNNFAEQTHWVGSFPENLELPQHPDWRQHKRLPEDEFRAMMARARVVLFFSDYEGFGRPPVEATLAGACPVYSDIPATREVMEGRGCPFNNDSYKSFAAALNRGLSVGPEQLQVWAEELSVLHDWNSVAGRVLNAILEAT